LYQNENIPVHTWESVEINKFYEHLPFSIVPSIVEDVMNSDVFTINEYASVELAKNIMDWNNFHHLVVEDDEKNLTGVISAKQLEPLDSTSDAQPIKTFMTEAIITVEPQVTLEAAKKRMEKYNIHSLPVLEQGILVGIITDSDLVYSN
jgi:acetoin utilization protein AcuB